MKCFTRILSVTALFTFLSGSTYAQLANTDVISGWNTILLNTMSTQNPFAQGRYAAITQLAVFEAVNAISHDYEPYLGSVNAPPDASAEAAAIAAAHRVLWTYFPGSAATLDGERANWLAAIPDGPAKANGISAGEAAAAAMIVARAADGSSTPVPYTPLAGPGFWQPTPPAFAAGTLLHWSKLIPFGIVSGNQFRSNPPPSLNSGKYQRDYDEVKTVGGVASTERPKDRADVARFYAATNGVVVWNSAAVQIGPWQSGSIVEKARTLALLNIAINDALISSMDTKYFYQFWRPVTAIRSGDTDGNPRTEANVSFTPFITTPAFPSYPSAHASASYAAREVLERTGGVGHQSITLFNTSLPDVTLRYGKLQQITEDIDDARVYGGIHFRFDQEAGAWQGRHVGEYVYMHNLRPHRTK